MVGDPENGYQVYYKAFEAEEPVGNGVFTHGAYPFDHDNPTEEACYYDGEYLWLAVPTSVTNLNDYLVAQSDLGTPLAICYEVAEDTTVARSEQIPSYAGVTYTTNGNNLCVEYDYDPMIRFNKYPDPPAEEGDYMLVAHVGSDTTYEWIPFVDADSKDYCSEGNTLTFVNKTGDRVTISFPHLVNGVEVTTEDEVQDNESITYDIVSAAVKTGTVGIINGYNGYTSTDGLTFSVSETGMSADITAMHMYDVEVTGTDAVKDGEIILNKVLIPVY